ncbi:MAG TPA: glycogen synthase GlgA [Acidobacteriaceae bacterium]|jgi:starch synthase|nr:glycogen synthase GlgA [Acidobacteriaceae bacterium]
MQIVFAASECAPWARTGGLAEVIGSLPREIAALGHKVTVYVPYYRQVREQAPEKKYLIRSLTIPFQYYSRFAAILDGGVHDGVQVCFVNSPELFDREFLYGTAAGPYPDNWERFALYCRAVLEASKELGAPDVFHAHDWHAALLPVYLRTLYYFDPVLRNRATVQTVHNAGHQGRFPADTVEKLLFSWDIFTMERVEFYNQFNFLKGGVVYSDMVTTVSPRYAEEIQTPEYGAGLDGVFRRRAPELSGILNGVDYRQWNPAQDGNIAAHYTPENLEGKAVCRKDLLHAFGAGTVNENTAVLGMVTRLTTQKGIDLLAEAIDSLMREDVVLTILGTGEEYYEHLLRSLAERYPGRVLVRILYDETLAHKVKAGADMLLMPSRYEPCGLTQFHAMKYGTVPVVHGTGGLEDTVEEWNPEARTGTGFKFHGFDVENFVGAVRRALEVFHTKEAWTTVMRNAMAKDFSWGKSAAEYIEVYERAVRGRL